MLQRGFGDNPVKEGYWPYVYLQVAQVYNAMHDNDVVRGHISYLRAPYTFCRAYSKIPTPYRASKLAPQAYACQHLGWSASKLEYVLEIMAGPRQDDVITSSRVKFREDVFPGQGQTDTGAMQHAGADHVPHDTDDTMDDVTEPTPTDLPERAQHTHVGSTTYILEE